MTNLEEFLEKAAQYRAVTLQILEIAPSKSLGWKPDSALMSFGHHPLHIGQTEE